MRESTYHIGEVASRAGLSLRTVRYWESIGLVTPSGRTEGGFRLYTEQDVQRLLVVRALKPTGLTPEEILELLELRDRASLRPSVIGAPASDGARLEALLTVATERLRAQRERLIAAELAVELVRGIATGDRQAASA
jgi:MerR family transcriptional regulator, copper efflux regulator